MQVHGTKNRKAILKKPNKTKFPWKDQQNWPNSSYTNQEKENVQITNQEWKKELPIGTEIKIIILSRTMVCQQFG